MYDFSFLAPCPSSGLFLHGGDDTLVPMETVRALAEKLAHQRDITIDYRIVAGADHFFNDKTADMTREIEDYLDQVIIGVNPIRGGTATMDSR
ncbi:MAG: alpha/beta hydrolase, partial [Alphaproteobacteria bacterium]